MKRLTLALVLALSSLGAIPEAHACDCQNKQVKKQCDCPGQSCPGPCPGADSDAKKEAKPKPDKTKGGTRS